MENQILFFLILPLPILITWFLLDIVRKLSIKFRLFAVPNDRSSHSKIVPATGGVALCISWIIIIYLYATFGGAEFDSDLYLYALAGIIISIVGFYDDMNELPSMVKLLLQIIVFYIISLGDNSLINSFHGLFGIYELTEFWSVVFSLFVFIVIVNAINLVDGIDGLSSSLALFFLGVTSYFYYLNDYYYFSLVLSFCSSLTVFLFFNYSKSKKIFLGDTGSLGIGLVVAVLSLGWLNTTHPLANTLPLNHAIFIVLLLAYPLLDVIRVFILRTFNGKSFMSADRNHLHHKIIDIGFTHQFAVTLILLYQSLLLGFNLIFMVGMNLHTQILINAGLISLSLFLLFKVPNKK